MRRVVLLAVFGIVALGPTAAVASDRPHESTGKAELGVGVATTVLSVGSYTGAAALHGIAMRDLRRTCRVALDTMPGRLDDTCDKSPLTDRLVPGVLFTLSASTGITAGAMYGAFAAIRDHRRGVERKSRGHIIGGAVTLGLGLALVGARIGLAFSEAGCTTYGCLRGHQVGEVLTGELGIAAVDAGGGTLLFGIDYRSTTKRRTAFQLLPGPTGASLGFAARW